MTTQETSRFEPQLVDLNELWHRHGELDAARTGTLYPSSEAKKIFGPDLEPGRFFLYLFRRFGLPPRPEYDDYKEACAYCFTTPHPEVFLCVSIKGGVGTTSMFGYAVPYDITERIVGDRSGKLKDECNEALLVTLKDFMRPVSIRDVYFNPLGEIDDIGDMPTAEYHTPYDHGVAAALDAALLAAKQNKAEETDKHQEDDPSYCMSRSELHCERTSCAECKRLRRIK